MAIDYTKLFSDLGEVVEATNALVGVLTTLEQAESEISVQLATNQTWDALGGQSNLFAGWKTAVVGWIDSLGATADAILMDRDNVLSNLPLLVGSSIKDVLAELIRQMNQDAQTVLENTTTIGAVSYEATNNGTFYVLTTKVLDGQTAPSKDLDSHPDYLGVNSGLASGSETMTLTCITDSETGGVEMCHEQFSWIGGLEYGDRFDWRGEGSGEGPTVETLESTTVLTNGLFEDWTANVPDDWTIWFGEDGIIKGGPGATPIQDSGYWVRFIGLAYSGSGITQSLTGLVESGKSYCVAIWLMYVTGGTLASGDLSVKISGSGIYQEVLSMTPSEIQATYGAMTLKHAFFTTPAEIRSGLELQVTIGNGDSGYLEAGKEVRLYAVLLGPTTWHGGVGVAIVSRKGGVTGAVLEGDRATFTVSNNDLGLFQTYMRKRYGVQLPSTNVPSISDGLASD